MQQWLKKVRVTFATGGLVINPGNATDEQLRVEFRISKTLSSSPNGAEVHLWNLSESSRNSVGKELDDLVLEAGYIGSSPFGTAGSVGIIFKGQVRDVRHVVYQGRGIDTIVTCGDGVKAMRKSHISQTFPKGDDAQKVCESVYEEFSKEGVDQGEWKFPEDLQKFKRPYSVCEPCVSAMNTVSRTNKFYWSIQNGAMEIVPANGYLPGTVYLSSSCGMVGVPTITDNGIRVVSRINPEIRPNRTITVASETLKLNAVSGVYRIGALEYYGDNMEGDFNINIEAESVQSGDTVDEGISVRKALPV